MFMYHLLPPQGIAGPNTHSQASQENVSRGYREVLSTTLGWSIYACAVYQQHHSDVMWF